MVTIWTGDMILFISNIGGAYELADIFLLRAVEGVTSPTMSLTQLITEGWKMKSDESSNKRCIHMLKYGSRITFVEKRSNLHCLRAKITKEVVINNHVTQEKTRCSRRG